MLRILNSEEIHMVSGGCNQDVDRAAFAVANLIVGTDTQNPNNAILSRADLSWLGAEIALFVGPDGVVKAVHPGETVATDTVFIAWDGSIELNAENPIPPGAEGVIHNHPLYEYDEVADEFRITTTVSQAENRYPSDNDWATLELMYQSNKGDNDNFDPSLYIVGPDGVTREFSYSDKAKFQALTTTDRMNGVSLPPAITNESIGSEENCQENDAGSDPDDVEDEASEVDDADYDSTWDDIEDEVEDETEGEAHGPGEEFEDPEEEE